MASKGNALKGETAKLFLEIARSSKESKTEALSVLLQEMEYRIQMREHDKYIKKLAKLKERIRKLVIEAEKC